MPSCLIHGEPGSSQGNRKHSEFLQKGGECKDLVMQLVEEAEWVSPDINKPASSPSWKDRWKGWCYQSPGARFTWWKLEPGGWSGERCTIGRWTQLLHSSCLEQGENHRTSQAPPLPPLVSHLFTSVYPCLNPAGSQGSRNLGSFPWYTTWAK